MRTIAALTLGFLLAACGSSETEPAPTTSTPTELRDYPYCELIADTVADGTLTQNIFNTLGFNACPADVWETITEQSVIDAYNAQYGASATSATVNGRRHWVLDNMVSNGGVTSSGATLVVNGMTLGLRGLITVPAGSATIGTSPYVASVVSRNTTYTFKKGRYVYELLDPCGNVYVMQSYSQQFAWVTLAMLSTPEFKAMLDLPAGWDYRYRKLDADLLLTNPGQTYIVNDLLRGTYQYNPAESTGDPSCW